MRGQLSTLPYRLPLDSLPDSLFDSLSDSLFDSWTDSLLDSLPDSWSDSWSDSCPQDRYQPRSIELLMPLLACHPSISLHLKQTLKLSHILRTGDREIGGFAYYLEVKRVRG